MARMTQEEKKTEFQENLKTMKESADGQYAYNAAFADQSNAENLLATGGGEELGALEQELAALSAMNAIRESERKQAVTQDMLFEQDIRLGMRDKGYIEATAELQRRKGIKSHRWDKTRKSRMETSMETLSKANDKIRALKARLRPAKGKAPMSATQRAAALKEIYDQIRIADRNFAEAIALNEDEEKRLKDKAEITYAKSIKRMLEREMEPLSKDGAEYARLRELAGLNNKTYEGLMRPYLERQAADEREEDLRDLNRKSIDPVQEPAAGPQLLDAAAEEVVTANIRLFGQFCRGRHEYDKGLDVYQYGSPDELWRGMKKAAEDLLSGWETKSDLERGDALGDVLIAANKILCKEGEKSKADKQREVAARQFRSFFKSVIESMSLNCRVLALERIFKKVDDIEDDPDAPEALKEANESIFTELARERYRREHPDLDEKDDALTMINDTHYRVAYAAEKKKMHEQNVSRLFGNTEEYKRAGKKFDFSRVTVFGAIADDFRVDRFGNVLDEDKEKTKQWENLIKDIADADTKKALNIHREWYGRIEKLGFDPEWLTEKGFKRHAYEIRAFNQLITGMQNLATDWKSRGGIDVNQLKAQGEILEKLPVLRAKVDVQFDMIGAQFLNSIMNVKGITWERDINIADPEDLTNLKQTLKYIKEGGEACRHKAELGLVLVHQNGEVFSRRTDVGRNGKFVTNPENPLMFAHEKARPDLIKKAKDYKAAGYLSGESKFEDSMYRVDTRISLFTKVEEDAMSKLKALVKDKGNAKTLSKIEKMSADYLKEIRVQAFEAETLLQADVDGTDEKNHSIYMEETGYYLKQKEKINSLFDDLETARENFLTETVGKDAYDAWKKEVEDARSSSRKKLTKLENRNTTAFERVKRAYAYDKATSEAADFSNEEHALIEKNNKKHGNWALHQRNRVLKTFILPVYRDFSGAYLTEFDRYKDDFNKRFKQAMTQGKEEDIKALSREFTEKILSRVTYADTTDLRKATPEDVERNYINTGAISFRRIKLNMISVVNNVANTNYPLLKTGLDELKQNDPERYAELEPVLSLADDVAWDLIMLAEGFDTDKIGSVPENGRKGYKASSEGNIIGLEDRLKKVTKAPVEPVDTPLWTEEDEKLYRARKNEDKEDDREDDKEDEIRTDAFKEDEIKYRFIAPNVPVFAVGDNEQAWETHKEDRVEFGFSEETLDGMSEQDLALMWQGKVEGKPDGYVPRDVDLNEIRQTYLVGKLSPEDLKAYENSLSGGQETGASLRLLKDRGLWDMYYLIDLTHSYIAYKLAEEEKRQKEQENLIRREAVIGSHQLPVREHGYEKQTGANCYGCAGSKIINHLTGGKVLDQYRIRGFKPRYLSREEFLALGVNLDYDASKAEVDVFAGPDKTRYGNIFAISDVVFDKEKYGGLGRKDIAVHKCTFGLGAAKSPNAQANMIEAMKARLHGILGTGEPVAFFSKGHYVTVVGLNDNRISHLDSLDHKPKEAITEDLSEFLRSIGGGHDLSTVELTWATRITPQSLDELKAEYGGLGIDEQTGEVIRTNGVQEFDDVSHRAGIAIRKTNAKIEEDGNADISHYVTESVCIHRGAFMTEEQFAQWEARDDETWAHIQHEEPVPQQVFVPAEDTQEKTGEEKRAEKKPDDAPVKEEKKADDAPVKESLKDQREYLGIRVEKVNNTIKKGAEARRIALYGPNAVREEDSNESMEARNKRQARENCLLTSIRCMRLLDVNATEEDLCDRYVAMDRTKEQDGPVSRFEISRKARAMEDLVGRILSFDIHKEFTTKDPNEMMELYFKYEPLFSFVSDPAPFIDELKAIQKSNEVPMALSEAAIQNARVYMFEIDEYGKYYYDLVKNNGKEGKNKLPKPDQRLVADELRIKHAEDIKNKWNGYDEGAAPVLDHYEFRAKNLIHDRALDDRIKTARRWDVQRYGYGYDPDLGRAVLKAAVRNGYDDGLSADIYRALSKDAAAADEAGREEYVYAAERMFRSVLSADVEAMRKAGLSGLWRNEEYRQRFADAVSIASEVRKMIPVYRGIEGAGKVLADEQISAVEGICSLLMSAKDLMDRQITETENSLILGQKENGGNPDELDAEYEKLFADQKQTLAENAGTAVRLIDSKSVQLQNTRWQKAGADLDERIRKGLPQFDPVLDTDRLFAGYRQAFAPRKDYTPSRRDLEMKTEGTELYNKNARKTRMIEGANRTKDRIAHARRMISFNTRLGLSPEQFKAVSAYFTGNVSDDSFLIRSISGKADITDSVSKEGNVTLAKETAFRIVTERFLSITTEDLDLSTDEMLAANAERLEDISLKVQAMKVLMDGDPAFVQMLSEQPAGMREDAEKESLYERVMKQMDRLGRLSDHYRVRKLVMTDAYFLTHYDDEIAITSKNAGSAERDKLSRLLMKSRDTAQMTDDVIEGDKVLPPWMTSGSTEVIEALENEHKTRALAEGRFDLSLISKESMKSVLQDIKDFHSRYPGTSIKDHWPLVQQRMKGYSKEFRQMMRQFYVINNVDEITEEGSTSPEHMSS